ASEGSKEAPVDAAMLLLQGKRHLLVQDFPSAVASLQEACQLLGTLYGETAPQCGEAYLCYGKALLELARQETGVLGNALGEDQNSEEEEEDDDDEEAEAEEGEGSGGEAAGRTAIFVYQCTLSSHTWGHEEEYTTREPQFGHPWPIGRQVTRCHASNATWLARDNVAVCLTRPVTVCLLLPHWLANGHVTMACLPTGGSKASESKAEVPKSHDVAMKEKEKVAEGSSPSVEGSGDSKLLGEGARAPASGSAPVMEVMDTQEVKGAEGESPAEVEKEEDAEEDLEKPEPALKEDPEPSEPGQPGTSSGTSAPPPKDEEEVSNLQLAWEVLELAKIIFEGQAKEGNREAQLKVADILLKLGEISLESDNCDQAVEDLGKCLCIQQEMLEADNRQLAETHYQRGLAYSFAGHYEEAANDFRAALSALELRVDNLTKLIEESKGKERTGSLDDDPIWRAEREVEDLKGLLPEVRAKVEDTHDMMRQNCDALKDAAIQKMMDRKPVRTP
ncbi:unnamed protein product, partial [Ixodes hexagonus]